MARITFDSLKLNRAILEIRYPKGYLYWDVCGKCVLDINDKSQEKIDFLELKADECILRFVENSTARASFGVKHMTLSATKPRNLNLVKENAPLIFESVKTHLKIEQISRVGFRLFYVLKKDPYEEAEKFVNGLELYTLNIDRFKGFGEELSVAHATVLASNKLDYASISVGPAKRTDADEPSAEFDDFAPRHAVLIDIDFYRENIRVTQFDLERFIHDSEKKIKDNISHLLNK